MASVSGGLSNNIGGLIGSNSGSVNNSFSIGTVTGDGVVGGLIGFDNGGSYTNSFWDSQTSGQPASDGGTGSPTVFMKKQITFCPSGDCDGDTTKFDFANNWGIVQDSSYPYLLAFNSNAPRAISGQADLSLGAGTTIYLLSDGVIIDTTLTAANATFSFTIPFSSITDGEHLLFYVGDNVDYQSNAVAFAPSDGGSITGVQLFQNDIRVHDTVATMTNSLFDTVKGIHTTTDILYGITGSNLVLGNVAHTDANLFTTSTTAYTVDGTITSFGSGTSVTFAGPTTLNASVTTTGAQNYASITMTNASTLTGSDINIAGNIVGGNNALIINNTGTSSAVTGVISDLASFEKDGTGTLSFDNANNYANTTTITDGTLTATNSTSFGTSNVIVGAGATLTMDGSSLAIANTISLGAGSTISDISSTGDNSLSGVITLTGANSIFNVTDSGTTLTVSNAMTDSTGSFGFSKTGSGNLVLSNNNTYDGGTTLTGGTIEANSATGTPFGTGTLTLNGGTLIAGDSLGVAITNVFDVTASSTIDGTNDITLSGTGTFSSGTLTVNNSGTTTLSNAITGSGNLTQLAGTVIMSGNNSYTGTTTLTAGSLEANNATNPFGTGALVLNGGTITASVDTTLGNSSYTIGAGNIVSIGGDSDITISNAGSIGTGGLLTNTSGGIITLSNVLSGDGALTQNGSGGVLVLSGANTSYTGAITLTDGALQAGNATNPFGTGALVLNGGTITASVDTTLGNSSYTIGAGNTVSIGGDSDITISNAGSIGTGGLLNITNTSGGIITLSNVLSGDGALTQNGSGGVLVLSGANTSYTGAITLTDGALQASNATNPFGTGALNLDGGTITASVNTTLGNSSYTIGAGNTVSIGGDSDITISNAGSIGTGGLLNITNTSGGIITLSNVLSGDGALTQNGSGGVLVLSGTNTSYTGAITLTDGALQADNAEQPIWYRRISPEWRHTHRFSRHHLG